MANRFRATLEELYPGKEPEAGARLDALAEAFSSENRDAVRFFSAPGRVEVGGNHTDHQGGHILAAAVELDMVAAVLPREDGIMCVHSAGFEPFEVSTAQLTPQKEEGTSAAFLRGVADYFQQKGYKVGGFTAYMDSQVPAGASLSSSACFAVLMGAILNGLYNDGAVSATELALAAKWAENVHFGKPCGLMDQLASATGGFISVDFADETNPVIRQVLCDLRSYDLQLCILNSKGSHANLTDQYAAIPAEMKQVAAFFGKERLSQMKEEEFYQHIGQLRGAVSDRAIMRAMHYFSDDRRAVMEADALERGDIPLFLSLINASGTSSEILLENTAPEDPNERSLALSIGYAKRLLGGRGACRVQGGGFAGTAEAFVPVSMVDAFVRDFEALFGPDSVYLMNIRPYGGVEIIGK